MNNEQFRRLLQDNDNNDGGNDTGRSGNKHTPSRDGSSAGGATPAPGMALGSRMRSNIPMTPRSVTGPNFARQLAEYRREAHQPPTKRFRSSAAPKGTRLPSGYQDRAQLRKVQQGGEDDVGPGTETNTAARSGSGPGMDLEQRIAALEELVKKGQIDRATFEKLRIELGVGGDVQSTHMVKGLDWELLKKVKAGEDVSKPPEKSTGEEEKASEDGEGNNEGEVDLEAEFERVTEQKGQEEIAPTAPKERKEKKGTMAPPPPKKSRNEILKELRASRAAAAAQPSPQPAESVLGSKFKKLGDSTKTEKKRWVEQDESGRRKEILVMTDAQGKTKRKTRWLDKPGEPSGLLMPGKDAKPLGMDVPADVAAKAAAAPPEDGDEDGDIFEGVGADYNPLADIDDDDSSSDSGEETGVVAEPTTKKPKPLAPTEPTAEDPTQPARPRNYFSTTTSNEATEADQDQARANPLTRDPSLLAAFKRAAALRQAGEANDEKEKDGSRGQRFLEEVRRREAQDAMDMDLGFGGSRNEDEEEEEPVALEGEGPSRGGQKRKRGPKKRKGDKEDVSDVMKVLEARK